MLNVKCMNIIHMAMGKKAFADLYKPRTVSNKLIIAILKCVNCIT
jgi:hypothetical protein